MKKITILIMLAAFTLPGIAQQRRGIQRTLQGPPPAPKIELIEVEDPLSKFAVDGSLPNSQIFTAVSNSKAAAEMIMANDENSLSALIGALQFAGFTIIDRNQKILFAPRWASNGTAFYDFEIAGMLRGSQLGLASSISGFGNTLADEDADLKQMDLPRQIFDSLKAARNSKEHENRFLANLIFDLSKYKPLTSVDSPLNMIQISLIERRFLGDLIDAYIEASQNVSLPGQPSSAGLFRKRSELSYIKAAYSTPGLRDPCKELEDMEKLAGYESKAKKVGKLFGLEVETLTPMGKIKKVFEPISKQIEKANIVMSYLKLIMANINLEGKVDAPPPMPYERTKLNTEDGNGEKIITASFKIRSNDSEAINCAGKALKLISGLSIQVPKDGPMKDVPVHWEPIYEGSGNDRYTTNFPVIHQAVPDRFKNISDLKTDENGESKIKIIGQRQNRDLSKMAVFEVPKRVRYQIRIATEKMDAEKDIPKIFWGGLDLKSGGFIKFLIQFIPDMMGKMALRSFRVEIPIKDWKPCTADDNWGGEVSFTRDKWTPTENIHESARITLVALAEGEPKTEGKRPNAYFDVYGYRTKDGQTISADDPCCPGLTRSQSGSRFDFSGTFEAPFNIDYHGRDNEFSLGFSFHTPEIKAKKREYLKVLSTACPYDNDDGYDNSVETTMNFGAALTSGHYQTRYVDKGGEHLVGETTYVDHEGATVKWQWNLTHCRTAVKR